jgi:hypothetical protein
MRVNPKYSGHAVKIINLTIRPIGAAITLEVVPSRM